MFHREPIMVSSQSQGVKQLSFLCIIIFYLSKDFGVNWNDINWEKSYNPIKAYGQSKSANVLFSKELAKRLKGSKNLDYILKNLLNFKFELLNKGTGVFTASLHPGAVRTELLRYVGDGIHSIVPMLIKLAHPVFLVLFKSSYEGAQTTIHCAVADGLEKYNGFYFRYG